MIANRTMCLSSWVVRCFGNPLGVKSRFMGPRSWKCHDPSISLSILIRLICSAFWNIARFHQTQHMGLRLNGFPHDRGSLPSRPGYRKSEQSRRIQRSLAIGGIGRHGEFFLLWLVSVWKRKNQTACFLSSCSTTGQVGAAHNSMFVCFLVSSFLVYIQRYVAMI